MLENQGERPSAQDAVEADKTNLHKSAEALLNYWAVDRLDIHYAVRLCFKSMSAGIIRYGQHLFLIWSNDQTVIAMSSGEAELYQVHDRSSSDDWQMFKRKARYAKVCQTPESFPRGKQHPADSLCKARVIGEET